MSENSTASSKFNPTAVMQTPEEVLIKTPMSDSFAIELLTLSLKTSYLLALFAFILTTLAVVALPLDAIIFVPSLGNLQFETICKNFDKYLIYENHSTQVIK